MQRLPGQWQLRMDKEGVFIRDAAQTVIWTQYLDIIEALSVIFPQEDIQDLLRHK